MKRTKRIFNTKSHYHNERGGMMMELLLTLALITVLLPFIVNFQKSRINRAENIAVANEMSGVQSALERYIAANKKELLAPVGKNITRVKIEELVEFGVPESVIEKHGDDFQVRILKSNDSYDRATLQGVIVLSSKDISPLRTREIISLGDDKMGFVEGGKAFGTFGTWHANAIDLGLSDTTGIIETTNTISDESMYLWRIPSENASDATMLSALNMAGHDIINSKFFDTMTAQFEEVLKAEVIVANKLIFQNKTTIDKHFESAEAIVSGAMSADSRSMEIYGTFNLANTAKFSNFTADDLWVMNLSLSGLSVSSVKPAVLKINQSADMAAGHISAMFVSVGFTGSLTPKLVVRERIEDSTDESYFWDISTNSAHFSDLSLAELNRMAPIVVKKETDGRTVSGQTFGTTVTNKNATASDFMNSISEIQKRVRVKYHQLNLE